MTVTTDVQSIVYDTDGSTADFPIPFYFLRAADITAELIDATDNLTVLVLGTDFTITGAGNPSGGALIAGQPFAAGYKLHVYRVVPVTQESQYQQNDPFPAKTTEKALDKLTMLVQQQKQTTDRALVVPRSDLNPDTTLPPSRLRANKALGFDRDGNVIAIDLKIGYVVAPVVDSVAMVRLVPGTVTAVFALGYDAAGDGGGGDYYPDRSDTSSPDDGGTCLISAIDGTRFKLRSHSFISSKQMGVFPTKSAAWNTQQMQAGISSGFGKFVFDCRNTSDIIKINGPITVPMQMEIESNVRWAGTLQQTALNQPIFVVPAGSADVSIANIHLSYDGVPVSGADAIQLNGCFAFSAQNIWISSCWNGIFANLGGNHELIGLRIFGYENCALLLSSCTDVNLTQFRFHANDSIKGRLGGIRLQGPVEGCTFAQGDVTLGQYGLTTQDFGNNARGAAPYFNRFVAVYFDSAKTNPALLTSLCDSDFEGCWFASGGHDEAVGWSTALASPGAFITNCIDLRFNGGNFENNGGPGAQVYANCKRVSFDGGVTFKHNQFSRNADGAAVQFLPGTSDWRVQSCNFARDADTTTYRQRYYVEVGAGASDRFICADNLLGGCEPNINTTGTNYRFANNY
ncbi:hypothetical protein [Burkholderia metallica]|uniref:hypothetical protein n=1 Tax=Burkholderia metallica TaxID=488729 RepID=UPI001F5BBD99|nr:hypothetical protein [Burkholderia metallica]